jgi:hypothetical protein
MPESTTIIVKNDTDPVKYIKFIESKLDKDIGYYYWKKYVAAAFWSQVSTPINLTITILTGLTTMQATSPDIIPEYLYTQIAIGTLVITTLNTFFRPHTQLTHNTEMMQKWNEIGIEFEKVYYGDICSTEEHFKERIEQYQGIQEKTSTLRKQEGPATINFLTDLIFVFAMCTCITRNKKWLDNDKRIQKKNETREKKEALKKEKEEIERLTKLKKLTVVDDANGKPKEFSQKNPLVVTKK